MLERCELVMRTQFDGSQFQVARTSCPRIDGAICDELLLHASACCLSGSHIDRETLSLIHWRDRQGQKKPVGSGGVSETAAHRTLRSITWHGRLACSV